MPSRSEKATLALVRALCPARIVESDESRRGRERTEHFKSQRCAKCGASARQSWETGLGFKHWIVREGRLYHRSCWRAVQMVRYRQAQKLGWTRKDAKAGAFSATNTHK